MITRALYFPKGTFDGYLISDPWYGPEVKYRCSRKILPTSKYDEGIVVFYNIDTHRESGFENVILDLAIVRQTRVNAFDFAARIGDDGYVVTGMSSLFKGRATDFEIGVDTASLYIGSQGAFKAGGSSACISTGGDGFLGSFTDFSYTADDWSRYREYVLRKGGPKLPTEFPFGGKSSWFVTFGALGFDGSMVSEGYLDSMVRANFSFRVMPKEIPITLGKDWVQLDQLWHNVSN